jgi:phosphoribosyl-ATP pyrophosphohydrolase
MVLVAARDAHLSEVYAELLRRRGRSGLDEKSARKSKPGG